jgi:hypothetical protein
MYTRTSRSQRRPRSVRTIGLMSAAALIASVSLPITAKAQLSNAGFENAPQTAGFTTVSSGNFVDPGSNTWKVTAGSIDIGTGPAGTTCHTGHCIDLNGNSQGRIEQVLKGLSPGQACTVRFYESRHTGMATATLTAQVNHIATSPGTFVHNTAGVVPSDGKWEPRSFTFTTVTSSDTLAFASSISGGAGPQIDDITIDCAPVPPPPPSNPVNACCPPWNVSTLGDQMMYQGTGGIGSRYTLKYMPTSVFNTQITAYMAYVHAMVPGATSIGIDFRLFDAGSGGTPVVGALLAGPFTETWGSSGGPSPTPSFFSPAPPAMAVNHWYQIQTFIHLNGGTFFSDSCAHVNISVRIQVQAALAAGQQSAARLQIRMADGQMVERDIKP